MFAVTTVRRKVLDEPDATGDGRIEIIGCQYRCLDGHCGACQCQRRKEQRPRQAVEQSPEFHGGKERSNVIATVMDIFTFDHLHHNQVAHVALYSPINNASDIRNRIVAAARADGHEGQKERDEMNFAFVDATLVSTISCFTDLPDDSVLRLPAGFT